MKLAIVSWIQEGGMARSVLHGFEGAGVAARLFRYPTSAPNLHVPAIRGTGVLTRYLHAALRPINARALYRQLSSYGPDVVMFHKCDDIHRRTYRRIRESTGAKLVAFHPDDPFNWGAPWRPGPSHRRAVAQMQEVDIYFVWSHELVRQALHAGARRSEYLPFACDPVLHRPPASLTMVPDELRAEVCFIGNWDEERERWLKEVARLGVDLAIWGRSFWKTRCRDVAVRAAWRGRSLYGPDLAGAVAASRINLNILRVQNKGACNMRTFEIPCASGFMLHERSAALAELFEPGKECADFGSVAELAEQIRFYLAHEEHRLRIQNAGHLRAQSHTYTQWARRMLEHIA